MSLVRYLGLSFGRRLSSCFHNGKARSRSLVSSFTVVKYSSLVVNNSMTNVNDTASILSTLETHGIPDISLRDCDDGALLFLHVLGINHGSDFGRQTDLLR